MSLEKLKKNKNLEKTCYICFEVNPPRGTDLATVFQKLEGRLDNVDFLNITDNALARMKMAALPFASIIKKRFGIEPLVNLTCRDRNSIALQSDLLAACAMEVNSVVALTGDAISVGDNSQAKAVFEMNSVGLISLIQNLNGGKDLIGNKLNGKTEIVPGCVVNPNAKNLDAEIRKLEKKIAAGAVYALSQPVFDKEVARLFVEKTQDLDCSIFLGLMPFGSAKAILGVQSVPGIKVSSELLELQNSTNEVITETSINLSLEIVNENLGKVAGFHIISGANSALALDLVKRVVAVVKK